MSLTQALFGPFLPDPTRAARPLVTYYDDATGERIELSALTLDNWIAKTANLLTDECDVGPGTPLVLRLPTHWQTAVVLLASWACGAHVLGPDAATADAEVAFCDAASVAASADAGLVVAFSLDAFGRGLVDLPAAAVDYATEVRVHGDRFVPPSPVGDDGPALDGASAAAVRDLARARAAELGLSPGDRVLSTHDWSPTASGGLLDGLLAPLAAGASVVVLRHGRDPGRTAAAERTTVHLGG